MKIAQIEKYRNKVNPRISKDISSIFKPYWQLINKSSDYYKLRSIGIDIGRINIKVKKDVENLLEAFKKAALARIEEKASKVHAKDEDIEKNNINFPKISKKHWPLLYNSMFGKMVVNLSYEDFKIITNRANKIRFYSFEIRNNKILERKIKAALRNMKNAILILTGNRETTLDELDSVWDCTLRNIPKKAKTAFAYKIGNVRNLQLNLLTTK